MFANDIRLQSIGIAPVRRKKTRIHLCEVICCCLSDPGGMGRGDAGVFKAEGVVGGTKMILRRLEGLYASNKMGKGAKLREQNAGFFARVGREREGERERETYPPSPENGSWHSFRLFI